MVGENGLVIKLSNKSFSLTIRHGSSDPTLFKQKQKFESFCTFENYGYSLLKTNRKNSLRT